MFVFGNWRVFFGQLVSTLTGFEYLLLFSGFYKQELRLNRRIGVYTCILSVKFGALRKERTHLPVEYNQLQSRKRDIPRYSQRCNAKNSN